MSFFVRIYATLAEWRAVVERLTGFEQAVAEGERLKRVSELTHEERDGIGLGIDGLDVRLPTGAPLVRAEKVSIAPAESVLVTGATGSGKSTLFRAIAGIWPFGAGKIATGKGKKLMVLPQRPYVPFGTLAAALTYPDAPDRFSRAALSEALDAVGLAKFKERLDEDASWPHMPSQGEQQRLSLARALLGKPDLLPARRGDLGARRGFGSGALRADRRSGLPQATVISIGHRSTLFGLHQRRFDFRRLPDGGHRMEPAPLAAA